MERNMESRVTTLANSNSMAVDPPMSMPNESMNPCSSGWMLLLFVSILKIIVFEIDVPSLKSGKNVGPLLSHTNYMPTISYLATLKRHVKAVNAVQFSPKCIRFLFFDIPSINFI